MQLKTKFDNFILIISTHFFPMIHGKSGIKDIFTILIQTAQSICKSLPIKD